MSKRKKHNYGYHRSGRKYLPEEILPLLENPKWPENPRPRRIQLDGDWINVNSRRLFTFREHGIDCACCGLKGQFFTKEKHKNGKQQGQKVFYHLNLYGIEHNGTEVLMTSDHVKPLSDGGKNALANRQTMCARCNMIKGSQIIENEDLIWQVLGDSIVSLPDEEPQVSENSRFFTFEQLQLF